MKINEIVIVTRDIPASPTPLYKGDEVKLRRMFVNRQGETLLIFTMMNCEQDRNVLLGKEYAVALHELL